MGAGLAVHTFIAAVIESLPLRAHVQQVDEEIIRQLAWFLGQHAMLAACGIDVDGTQAADQHGQLGRSQRQQLGLVDQQGFGRRREAALQVVAETVSLGLQVLERFHIGLLLRGVAAARGERHGDLHACIGCRFFNAGVAGQHDQVGQRDAIVTISSLVELALDAFQHAQHLASCSGWLTCQSFCGARRMRAPLAPPRISEPR